jgi:hypothetical protein
MKTYRLLSPVVVEQLEEIAKTTRLSPTQIMEIALIQLFGDDNNFISCPGCGDHLAIKGTMSSEPPLEVYPCGCCGTSVAYDTDKEDIIHS